MEHELTLNDLLGCLKRNWWKIVIFALLMALLMGVITYFFIPKKYISTVEFYIINTNESADYTQTALLSATAQLANDYIELINGDEIMSAVSTELKERGVADLNEKSLRKRISSETMEDTSMFQISVEDTDLDRAYEIACVIAEIAPDMLTDITKPGQRTASVPITTSLNAIADELGTDYAEDAAALRVLSEKLKEDNSTATVVAVLDRKDAVKINLNPEPAKTHSSPNMLRNCLLAGIIGAVISFAYFILRSLLNTIIRIEDDVKRAFKYPIIGIIPSWDISEKNNYEKADRIDSK